MTHGAGVLIGPRYTLLMRGVPRHVLESSLGGNFLAGERVFLEKNVK